MDAVHEADQPLDIGVCPQHNRVFECYCTQCYCMICPSCLMFDDHRRHEVCKIEEGAKDIRQRINNAAKEGSLKFEKTQNVLLDIRHVKLSLQENQETILKNAQNSFDDLIATLKHRKTQFLNEVKQHFCEELEKVEKTQNQWETKQQLSQHILSLQTSSDEIKLIEQAKRIVEGLGDLEKELQYKEIKLIEGIQTDSQYGKNCVNFGEMKELLKNFMKRGKPTINKLKC